MQEYNDALKEANKEWSGILAQLWVAFGKAVDPAQFKVYRDTLREVPLGVLESVVEATIKRHKYNTVPPLAVVNEVLEELHPGYEYGTYVHTRPHRDAAEAKRNVAREYPRPVSDYTRGWLAKVKQ